MPTRISTPLERALQRAPQDSEYRAHVVEDDRTVQAELGLTDVEWHVLFDEVERLEHSLAADPREATEVDHGEADAAGAKG